ncbi:HTH domain-containing protein [Tistlia consotensis]|uniref:HTH domain-containing protein n=1 Tax=Tistlia consotensis USBA 355 TaxID=560819 RepID=A0A1Y6CSC2_9PROT|nr:YafY family protein [Tistlia consotensis]SMF72844.1 HTH domain-containing protein [Tistlia consotensis USBA 355]SNS09832.1 HTH domain-containing protein [Tistlia consotensis]
MRPLHRLFETIQLLRAAGRPLTAAELAAALEVSTRTVYRDIAALQAMRLPIEGAAGLGYVIRASYDLPALNFDEAEVEALVVGLALLARTGDAGLQQAARRVLTKIEALRGASERFHVSPWVPESPGTVDPEILRAAIRDERKLRLRYADETGAETERVVRPIAVAYFVEAVLLAAWCELRRDFRHFRLDRIRDCAVLDERFAGEGEALRREWGRREGA